MNVTLVEHAEHDVNGDQRGQNQKWLVAERGLKGLCGALERGRYTGRHSDLGLSGFNRGDRVPQRIAGRQVERDRDGGKLSLMTHDQRNLALLELHEAAERYRAARRRREIDIPQRV